MAGLGDFLKEWKTQKDAEAEDGPGTKALKKILSDDVKTDEDAGLLATFLGELKGDKKGGK